MLNTLSAFRRQILKLSNLVRYASLNFGPTCANDQKKGLIIGVYENTENPEFPKLTPTAEKYNRSVNGGLMKLIKSLLPIPDNGEVRVFYRLDEEFAAIALVGLGKECLGYDSFEQMDEGKEAIRIAAGTGARSMQNLPIQKLCIESFGHAESAAEGAALAVWIFQELKAKRQQIQIPVLELYDDCDWTGWQIGLQKGAAQNLARQLTDTTSNLMTPTSFAQNAVDILCKSGVNIEVKIRSWAETQNMNAFLAHAQGSCEPPIFLELSYYGASRDERPVVLIGQGVTYNSGGLCLKHPKGQAYGRGEMAGAACVVATCRAVAGLQLPINIRGLLPLCENMTGCNSVRAGDVITAMNGKTITIETTECGRLSLVDTLVYAQSYWPRFILAIGTMTRDIRYALGGATCGVFTNSEALWEYMLAASMHTGDRVWRFPLWDYYGQLLTEMESCDVSTHGDGPKIGIGGACRVAAFLNEFVPCGDWMHMDIHSTMYNTGRELMYLREGMSGRPTRTIVEFISQLICHKG